MAARKGAHGFVSGNAAHARAVDPRRTKRGTTVAQGVERDGLGWTVPVMRAGYAGRGLVYLVVAGFSLWAVWHGGQAEGTESAFARLEGSTWGTAVLIAIALGMLAYAVWRTIDAAYDLEAEGSDAKGLVARAGQVTTGLIHLGLGFAAVSLLMGSGGGEGGKSGVAKAASAVMQWPYGPTLVAIAGALTIGAGVYYVAKAVKGSYRRKLYANAFTRNFDGALRFGVLAQAALVLIIGGFLLYAGLTADPSEAGGVGETFSWVSQQAYGRWLVAALCVGLLGFATFCFVNAAYRIVPRVAGDEATSLASA